MDHPRSVHLAHNGNLTNTSALPFDGDPLSDSEVLLNVFAVVAATHAKVRGSYAFVALIPGYGVRDP